jgi:hypothetical protein
MNVPYDLQMTNLLLSYFAVPLLPTFCFAPDITDTAQA